MAVPSMMSSKLSDCSMGRSAHLATFRILSAGRATWSKARHAFRSPDGVVFHAVVLPRGTYSGLQFLGKDKGLKPANLSAR